MLSRRNCLLICILISSILSVQVNAVEYISYELVNDAVTLADEVGPTASDNSTDSFSSDIPSATGFWFGIITIIVLTAVIIIVSLVHCCCKQPEDIQNSQTLVYLDDKPSFCFRRNLPLDGWKVDRAYCATRWCSLIAMIIQLLGLAFLISYALYLSDWLENFNPEEHTRFPRCPGQTIPQVSDTQAIRALYIVSGSLLTVAGLLWGAAHVFLFCYLKFLMEGRESNVAIEERKACFDSCCWIPWACCCCCASTTNFSRNNRREKKDATFHGRNSAYCWNRIALFFGLLGAASLITEGWVSTEQYNIAHTAAAIIYVLSSSFHYIILLAINFEYFEMRAPLHKGILYTLKIVALFTIALFFITNIVGDASEEYCNKVGDAWPLFEWYAFVIMVISHGMFYGDVASFQYRTAVPLKPVSLQPV